MKKTFIKLTAVVAGCICLAGIGGSWAHYINVVNIRNPLTTKNSAVELVENFNPNSTFLPGETVQKKPYFKNTGEVELVLRVKVEESWKKPDGATIENSVGIPDANLVIKNWTDSWRNDWLRIDDFYYYKKRLSPAGTEGSFTEYILDSLKLLPDASNDGHAIDYSSLIYELKFEADAVPADALSLETWSAELNKANGTGLGLEWQDLLPPGP